MTAPRTVLPTGATALEVVLDTTFPRGWGALADSAEPWATSRDAAMLPWLAQQWQVAQFAPYFDTAEALLDEAVPWLMERGTAAGAVRALRWIGFEQARVEEDGPYLHIHPGRLPAPHEVARIAHVVRASMPAHVALYRIVHGLDLRPIVLDSGPAADVGLLGGYSGVIDPDTGVVLSFGRSRAASTASPLQAAPAGRRTHRRMDISRYDDMPVLDTWRLDSRLLQAVAGGLRKQRSNTTSAPPLGGGAHLRRAVHVAAAPQALTAAPSAAGRRVRMAMAPVQISPPRRWGGPWGGPWRTPIYFINRYTKD